MNAKKIIRIAIISILSYIIMIFFKIPVSSFLTYEAKDPVIVIGGFLLGIIPTIIISFIVALIEMITISNTGIIGFLMNFVSTILYALPICYAYNKKTNMEIKEMLIVTSFGTIIMTVGMFIFNHIITPIYLGISIKEVMPLIIGVVTPFNIAKGFVNSIIIVVIYKPLINALKKANLF